MKPCTQYYVAIFIICILAIITLYFIIDGPIQHLASNMGNGSEKRAASKFLGRLFLIVLLAVLPMAATQEVIGTLKQCYPQCKK